ncbi:MAG: RluA family pseudouridine synthase [Alphaproteobacteria bacterium]|nr:RluA family pseudouridine synthase [Alphaproteobacteria bacterium]
MPELRTIGADDDGVRVDRWFKRHYPHVTHTLLEKLLRKGEVRLDGKRAKAADRIAAGQAMRLPPQVIHAKPPQRDKPDTEPKHLLATKDMGSLADRILYMDKQVIVIDKPPGLATQGGSGLTKHVDGMLDSLQYEKPTRPKLVHRLDRDTSGVLLIARTALAASGLSASLALRDTSKVYWALTRGVPKQKNGVVKGALAKEGGHGPHGRDERMAMTEEGDEGAKFSLTEYAVMATAGTEFAWVAARPITGRTHQIRVHLASLGTPIVGDFKYGGTDSRGKGDIADKLHLHARSIDIGRPDGGRLQATAPMPPHMVKSWKLLGFNPDDKSDPFPPKKTKKKR